MKCKNCGFELDEGARFCRKCGTAVPTATETKPKQRAWNLPDLSGLWKNRRLFTWIGVGAAAVLVLVLILCLTTCGGKKTGFQTPDEVFDAAIEALVNGDGDRLYEMTKTSEAFLGAHPETFGAGDSPTAVMKAYYADLAGAFRSELTETYGTGFELVPQIQTETLSGSAIFEANRALGIEAEEYATGSGSLSVNGAPVKDVYLVAAKLGGEWRLIVVYLYPAA